MNAGTPASSRYARWTVIYDGQCRVCGRIAETLRHWDAGRSLEIIPSQTPGLHARFPWISPQQCAESLQLVSPSGETLQGAAAMGRILDLLPRGWLLSWLFRAPLLRPLLERLYRWFARSRHRLGCGDHCPLE